MLPLGLYNVHCTRPHEEGAWTRGACTRSMLNGLLRQSRGLRGTLRVQYESLSGRKKQDAKHAKNTSGRREANKGILFVNVSQTVRLATRGHGGAGGISNTID